MTWLKKFLNHERYSVLALVASCFLIIWIVACDSTVRSIRYPNQKYTRQQMITERATMLAEYDHAFVQLDQMDAIKTTLLEHAIPITQGGTFNPFGLITSIAALLGVGATVDRVRSVTKKKTNTS